MSDLSRNEILLSKVVGEYEGELPPPHSRAEELLHILINRMSGSKTGSLPVPQSRLEQLYSKLIYKIEESGERTEQWLSIIIDKLNGEEISELPESQTAIDELFLDVIEGIDNFSGGEEIDPNMDWRYFTSQMTNFSHMFSHCDRLTTIPELDTSNGTGFNDMFYNCKQLTTIPELDTSNGTGFNYMFYNCNRLTTIPKLDLSNGTTVGNMFYNCENLTDITFVGTIITNLTIQYTTVITVESLLSIINALKDQTGLNAKTLTIGSTNKAKLTEKQLQIAYDKNWKVT